MTVALEGHPVSGSASVHKMTGLGAELAIAGFGRRTIPLRGSDADSEGQAEMRLCAFAELRYLPSSRLGAWNLTPADRPRCHIRSTT
jgi:hypothetical protein